MRLKIRLPGNTLIRISNDEGKGIVMRELVQHVWIGEDDMSSVFGNISEYGALVYQWDEDPEDTEEDVVYGELYEYKDMKVEVFYLDEAGKQIESIRAIIPIAEIMEDGTKRYYTEEKDLEAHFPDAIEPTSRYIRKKYIELMAGGPQ